MKIYQHIATLGPVGYFFAPGTVASVITLPIIHVLRSVCTTSSYMLLLLVSTIIAYIIIDKALPSFGRQHDPSAIVIDEVVGMLFTFMLVPFTTTTALFGLIFFRFFDIVKAFGISRIELLQGSWGILLDDIAAGIISALCLYVCISYNFL